MPSLYSIYAQRTIYNGYMNAFTEMGHEFRPLTADHASNEVFAQYRPDIFITSSFFWYRKYLDFGRLREFRNEGLFVLVKVDFWKTPMSKTRINEAPSLENDSAALDLIQQDLMGDVYFHTVEQDDERMNGFEEGTGHTYSTIPLAADATLMTPCFEKKYEADISYIGTNLPGKRSFFNRYVKPLAAEYDLRLYGQDWTSIDKVLGWVQRGGQFFNVPGLRSLRKPKLDLRDEAKIYTSSTVSINVHETYQRVFGGDCNERTFKIPICGGFQIVDDVACIKKYFNHGKEIVIADSDGDWVEKTKHYLANPDERLKIIEAGRKKVLEAHTYHHRASQMLALASEARSVQ